MGWLDTVKTYTGYNIGKNIINRAGQATGLISPDDKVDEDAALATPETQAAEAFRRALEQQDASSGLYSAAQGMAPAQQLFAPQIADPSLVSPTLASTTYTTPIERATATMAGQTRDVQLGPVNTTVTGSNLAPAAQTSFQAVQGARIDPLAGALRDDQLAAARALMNGPSVADQTMRLGMAQTVEEQMGLVNQARGNDRAEARREAILGMGAKGIQVAAAGSAAKAQEELAKRAAYAQSLAGIRATDVSTSTTQAELDQQRNSLDAQLRSAIAQGNTAAANAINVQRAQLDQDAKKATASLGLDAATAAAQVAGQTAGRMSQVDLSNASALNDAARANAAAANAADQANASRATGVSVSNAGVANDAAKFNSSIALDAARANQSAKLTAGQANQSAALAGDANRIQGMTGAVNAANSSTGQIINAANTGVDIARARLGAEGAQQTAESESAGRLVKTGSAIGASLTGTSDERAKTDVRSISDEDLLDFAESIRAASFKYKPGYEDGGRERHAGVPSAQELERNPVGELFVSKDKSGIRKVDYGQMAALIEAARLRNKGAR